MLLSTAVLVMCLAAFTDANYRSYKNYKLVSVEIDPWHFGRLQEFVSNNSQHLTIFMKPNKFVRHADVLISPEFNDRFHASFEQLKIKSSRILIEDMQKNIDYELQHNEQQNNRSERSSDSSGFNLTKFHSHDEMVRFMHDLHRRFSHISSVVYVGRSHDGRHIYGLKIGRPWPNKPVILIDAGVHAREWITSATALYIMNKLTENYGKVAQITRLVDVFDWIIVPLTNPDGYEYSRTYDRMWRKTRSVYTVANRACVGVDANRNWGFRWGEVGADRNSCTETYAGPSAFSEPEMAAMRDLIASLMPRIKLYINLHSYGQLWLAPWGHTLDKPRIHAEQKYAALVATDAIMKTSREKYYFERSAEFYPISGDSMDYVHELGVPYSYSVELRPGRHSLTEFFVDGFTPFANQITPTGEEMSAALLEIAEYISTRNNG